MANVKKEKYSIALAGQGFILKGTPKFPARSMGQAPVVGMTPSEIDLEFKDSSSFLPWAQTDFSGGYQKEKWQDLTFKKGTGLEYIKEYGQLTLLNDKTATVKSIGAYTFGAHAIFNNQLYIGSDGSPAVLGYLNASDTWADVTTGFTSITQINDMDVEDKLYMALKRSTGAEKCFQSWNGSAMADATGDATDSTEWRMVRRIESRLYASNYNSAANGDRLLYSDNNGTNWTAIITATGKNRQITKSIDNLGTLYFLIVDGKRTEFWWCNDVIITQIYRWENLTDAVLDSWLGRVYITGKENGEVKRFCWDGGTLKSIYEQKFSAEDVDAAGAVVWKNNLISYGLIYDGLIHFPSYVFKYSANKIYPFAVWGSSTAQVPYCYGLDSTTLKIIKLDTSAYLTTGNLITSTYDVGKPAAKKLWYSVTVGFKKLASGQSIKVEYSIDNETTWTEIDTISQSEVGSTITEDEVYFAANTSSYKIQLRFTLAGGGTDTPTMLDFVVRYLLLAEEKYQWGLTVQCEDDIVLLDGKSHESKTGIELRNILKNASVKNQIVEFQDVDYFETQLGASLTQTATTVTVDRTKDAPEQGRFRIEQEDILYTGKTATTFTGCTRGARGTKKQAHADDTQVDSGYSVLIAGISESTLPTAGKMKEALLGVRLIET